MPTKQEVGQRLRLARFRQNMTLKEVATRSGMSATHISEIERGKTSPTIGALQRIATALGERTAHFVEERAMKPACLVRKDERIRQFACDSEGQAINFERLTGNCPWGTTHITRMIAEPGESYHRPPANAESVLVCVSGMHRVTIGDESYVIRDGDTLQLRVDGGFFAENIGDDKGEVITISSFAARPSW
jgi:transcriptional regulator with XRE-family HTH domain